MTKEYSIFDGNLWEFDSNECLLSIVSKEDVILDGEIIIKKHERSYTIGCGIEQWKESKEDCLERANYEYSEEMSWLSKEIEDEMNSYF